MLDLGQSGVFFTMYLENDRNTLDVKGPHHCNISSESVAVFKSLVKVRRSGTIYKGDVQQYTFSCFLHLLRKILMESKTGPNFDLKKNYYFKVGGNFN